MRMFDQFIRAAKMWPDRACFIAGDATYSYADVYAQCRRVGAALRALPIEENARVAVYSPNDPMGFICILGTLCGNFTWVPLNAKNAADENAYIMDNTGCEVLFYHSSFGEQVAHIRANVPGLKHLVCIDRHDGDDRSLTEFMQSTSAELPEYLDDPDRRVCILSSGGTTGRPKGGVWNNRLWEAEIATFWSCAPFEGHAIHLVAAPMTHAAGVTAFCLFPRGATQVIIDKADPLLVMETIQRHKVTHLFLPPTVIYMMLAHPKVGDFDYSSLKYLLYAAAPMSPDKLTEAMKVFGPVMAQSYGQVEAPMFCTFMTPAEHHEALTQGKERRLWSAGRPTLLTQVEIMDDDGNLLPPNERGEVVVRGNLVMVGYYNNKEATDAVSTFGWHHTGDIGYKDEDSYVYIVDRKKDMIISGGFNVYSTEVEQAVLSHPAVQECVVIGVPDDKWGEAVKAVIEVKAGHKVTPEEIVALCKERLGSVKAPKTVEIWEALPRSAVGKVLKRTIRDKYWAGRQRAI